MSIVLAPVLPFVLLEEEFLGLFQSGCHLLSSDLPDQQVSAAGGSSEPFGTRTGKQNTSTSAPLIRSHAAAFFSLLFVIFHQKRNMFSFQAEGANLHLVSASVVACWLMQFQFQVFSWTQMVLFLVYEIGPQLWQQDQKLIPELSLLAVTHAGLR